MLLQDFYGRLSKTAAVARWVLVWRNLIILVLALALLWLVADRMLPERESGHVTTDMQATLEPIVPLPGSPADKQVADINVHTVDELEILFARIEQLLQRPHVDGEPPLISLILHGPEVEFFALENYDRYKTLVDHAARLSALGGVDISICQTQMRSRGIESGQVPGFLKQVPFGPGEVKRLVDEGYVYM